MNISLKGDAVRMYKNIGPLHFVNCFMKIASKERMNYRAKKPTKILQYRLLDFLDVLNDAQLENQKIFFKS